MTPLSNQQDDETIARYLREISKYKPLTIEQEKHCALRINCGDMTALDKLVKANLRFVVSVARHYQIQGISLCDLINEGNIGLIRAAMTYDEKKDLKFISYAVWWIKQKILNFLAQQSRLCKLPLNCAENIYKIRRVYRNLEQQFHRPPTDEEIVRESNLSYKALNLANSNDQQPISLDNQSVDKPDTTSLYEVIENASSEYPDEQVMNESLRKTIRKAIASLHHRERKILELYYGFNDNKCYTLEDIGDRFHITRERVRQIKNKALSRLKTTEIKNVLKECI